MVTSPLSLVFESNHLCKSTAGLTPEGLYSKLAEIDFLFTVYKKAGSASTGYL
jgi:hypothetical protein